ncbi:MAG TPA: hypothetical protein VFE98_00280 [Candidatus Bathyarchaeia archaeon]|nr:hypothetical protein [Candidatus Bathyarchaeia archaeon]
MQGLRSNNLCVAGPMEVGSAERLLVELESHKLLGKKNLAVRDVAWEGIGGVKCSASQDGIAHGLSGRGLLPGFTPIPLSWSGVQRYRIVELNQAGFQIPYRAEIVMIGNPRAFCGDNLIVGTNPCRVGEDIGVVYGCGSSVKRGLTANTQDLILTV